MKTGIKVATIGASIIVTGLLILAIVLAVTSNRPASPDEQTFRVSAYKAYLYDQIVGSNCLRAELNGDSYCLDPEGAIKDYIQSNHLSLDITNTNELEVTADIRLGEKQWQYAVQDKYARGEEPTIFIEKIKSVKVKPVKIIE